MKGKIRIAGKEYDCEVIDGERWIDGKPVHTFLKILAHFDPQAIEDLAEVGKKALDNEANEITGGLQDMANAMHSRRVN